MKTITFYYVRHGRTVYNKEGILQGQVESPLLEEGIPVLEETAEALKKISFTKCYSSPLSRAVNTAEIILKDKEIPVVLMDDLIEMSFGDIDGQPHKEHLKELFFLHLKDSFRSVHGESSKDVRIRARRALSRITAECEDGDQVLIGGHGSYYRYLVYEMFHQNRLFMKLNPHFYGIPNGAVSIFTCRDGKYELKCWPLCAEDLKAFLSK